MKAFVFPGQGAQFSGMGKELYDSNSTAKEMFEKANDILGYRISDIMFTGTDEELKETAITQPAIFLHSVICAMTMEGFEPSMVAGHSLGEFSALAASKAASFEDCLKLVDIRARAMQSACEEKESTMAAILGLDDDQVISGCSAVEGESVVAANFNCPGQVVISGSLKGVEIACQNMLDMGAKRALPLAVRGAFHSEFMQSAREKLDDAIANTKIVSPICPIYQNVSATAETDPEVIATNLSNQMVSPVRWGASVQKMMEAGATEFVEVGPGRALQGMVKKIDRRMPVSGVS